MLGSPMEKKRSLLARQHPNIPCMQVPPCVIGITGASCAGKSQLTSELARSLWAQGVSVVTVEQDRHRKSSRNNMTSEGKRTWEGPQFTNWPALLSSVKSATADIILVDGYMLLDDDAGLFEMLHGLIWVNSTREICAARRKSSPAAQKYGRQGWVSHAEYAIGAVWPAHEAHEARAEQRIDRDAGQSSGLSDAGAEATAALRNATSAPVSYLKADQGIEERVRVAMRMVQAWHERLRATSGGVPGSSGPSDAASVAPATSPGGKRQREEAEEAAEAAGQRQRGADAAVDQSAAYTEQ